jgi:hypothetical protein
MTVANDFAPDDCTVLRDDALFAANEDCDRLYELKLLRSIVVCMKESLNGGFVDPAGYADLSGEDTVTLFSRKEKSNKNDIRHALQAYRSTGYQRRRDSTNESVRSSCLFARQSPFA